MSGAESVAQDMLKFAKLIEALHLENRRLQFLELSGAEPPPSKYPDASLSVTRPILAARIPTHGGVSIDHAEFWLGMCASLSSKADDFDHETRKGYTIACKLLGLGWNDVQRAIGSARSVGVAQAAAVWAPYLGQPDPRYVGRVYVARTTSNLDVLKVGFSTDVDKRVRQLSKIEGERVVLIAHRPGTMMHEWALHMQLRPAVKSEWYPREAVPAWLLRAA